MNDSGLPFEAAPSNEVGTEQRNPVPDNVRGDADAQRLFHERILGWRLQYDDKNAHGREAEPAITIPGPFAAPESNKRDPSAHQRRYAR